MKSWIAFKTRWGDEGTEPLVLNRFWRQGKICKGGGFRGFGKFF